MTTVDPAVQRRILRRTLERALRQHTATKPAAAVALTEAVWRIIGPALEHRDAQLEAVRTLHHEWTDGAPGCCAHCQDGMGTPLAWPCPTIRALSARPDTRPTADPGELLVRILAHYVPACPSGRHAAHPAYTCDEQDQAALAWDKFVADSLGAALAGRDVTTVPPPLRGPAWAHPADISPLRDLAARIVGAPPDQQS